PSPLAASAPALASGPGSKRSSIQRWAAWPGSHGPRASRPTCAGTGQRLASRDLGTAQRSAPPLRARRAVDQPVVVAVDRGAPDPGRLEPCPRAPVVVADPHGQVREEGL